MTIKMKIILLPLLFTLATLSSYAQYKHDSLKTEKGYLKYSDWQTQDKPDFYYILYLGI